MVPYGYAQSCELTPQDEEYIDTNTNSYAMRSSTVDPTTGIISCRIDYYTADPAQVAKSASSGMCSAADTMRTKAVLSRCRCNKESRP